MDRAYAKRLLRTCQAQVKRYEAEGNSERVDWFKRQVEEWKQEVRSGS